MKEEFKIFSAGGVKYLDDGRVVYDISNSNELKDNVTDKYNYVYINPMEISSVSNTIVLPEGYFSCIVNMKNGDKHHVLGTANETVEFIRHCQDDMKNDYPDGSILIHLFSAERTVDFADILQNGTPNPKAKSFVPG